jgi:serine/threonine protein kinase
LPQLCSCYGLTQNPTTGDYMLVMSYFEMNLRKYLQEFHNQLKWKERLSIATDITLALGAIHGENIIHGNLHSGNILYSESSQKWVISDLGFCGPANKSSGCIYGNLRYMAPEVISGKNATKESDIYSIAMILWEISSGQPPFNDFESDDNLALKIINGMRPNIAAGTPIMYYDIMRSCWDAVPSKRPKISSIWAFIPTRSWWLKWHHLFDDLISLFIKLMNNNRKTNSLITNQNIPKETNALSLYMAIRETNCKLEINNLLTNYTYRKLFISKVHQFKNLPEPKNEVEGIVVIMQLIVILSLRKILIISLNFKNNFVFFLK